MKRFLGVSLLLLVTSIAMAQEQPRGRGGFGGGGFGGPGGGGSLFLLQGDDVQKELKITDDQKKKLTELSETSRKEMSSSFGSFNREEFQKLSEDEQRKRRDEMRKKFEESSKKTQTEVAKVLDAKQNERLSQLQLQREGINAIAREEVAGKLGLSGDQREEIEKIIQAGRPTGGPGGFGGSSEERRAAFEKMQKAREKAEKDLLAVLSPEQKSKWDAMLGAKFEFANRGFGGFGGGRGPGGGQPGGAGGQPGGGGQGGNRRPSSDTK